MHRRGHCCRQTMALMASAALLVMLGQLGDAAPTFSPSTLRPTTATPTLVPTTTAVPTLTTTRAPTKKSLRQDLCPVFLQYLNVTYDAVTAENALKGYTLDVAVNPDADPSMMYFASPTASAPSGGFLFTVQQELARRGGFKIRYVKTMPTSAFLSTEDYLLAVLPSVSIYGGAPVTDTAVRRDLVMDFTTKVIDNSVVMVTTQDFYKSSSYWEFSKPFAPLLWLMLVCVFFYHGLLFYVTERFLSVEKIQEVEKGPRLSLVQSMFESYGVTGEPEPTTVASGVLKIAFSYFVYVMLATYIANLANLYIDNMHPEIPITSIDDANLQNSAICALNGASAWCTDCASYSGTPYGFVNLTYPAINLVNVNSFDPVDLLVSINNGSCDGAVMTVAQWDAVQNLASANVDCRVIAQPAFPNSVITTYFGAFVTIMDYSILCTSVVQIVWSTLLTRMKEDGTFDELYASYLATKRKTTDCAATIRKRSSSFAVGIDGMSGVFIIFSIMVGASVLISLFTPYARSCASRAPPLPMTDDDVVVCIGGCCACGAAPSTHGRVPAGTSEASGKDGQHGASQRPLRSNTKATSSGQYGKSGKGGGDDGGGAATRI